MPVGVPSVSRKNPRHADAPFFSIRSCPIRRQTSRRARTPRRIAAEELREVYAVRCLLEVEATRLAAGKIGPQSLDALLGVFTRIRESGGIDPEWEHDRLLHRVIAEASGNRRLYAEISRYGDVVQTVREIVGGQDYGIHETTADEHHDINAALARFDAESAAEAMKKHLSQASDSAAEAVGRMRSMPAHD